MIRFAASMVLALAAASRVAGGQTPSLREDGNRLAGDVWNVWSAPARMERRDILPAALAAGTVAGFTLVDSTVASWMASHQKAGVLRLLAPIRTGGPLALSDLPSSPNIDVATVAAYAAGRLSHSTPLASGALGCETAHLAILGFRFIAYTAIGRERPAKTASPFHVSVPGSSDWNWQSFTAGHLSNAVACGTFLQKRFDLGVAEPLPYIYAAAVGIGRMADGWHWTSDSAAGALMGYAVGSAIAGRHRRRATDAAAAASTRLNVSLLHVDF